jgi:hypothetical protein
MSTEYQEKAKALGQIGLRVPDVVGELVFDLRNAAEHEYTPPDPDEARRAEEIARLFVEATESEYERSSIVALNWNVSTMRLADAAGSNVDTPVFGESAMLFIDVFDEPHAAKIVDPKGREVRFARLGSFSKKEAVDLSGVLRASYGLASYLVRGLGGAHWVKQIKSQGGF